MYEFEHREAFYHDEKNESITIVFKLDEDPEEAGPDITIRSSDIVDGSFEMYDAIMEADSLNFQSCMSSYIKFTTTYTENALMNKHITVTKYIEDNGDQYSVPLGKFYVKENVMSLDGKTQAAVAYDELYFIINSDPLIIKMLYDEIFQNVSPVNVKNFRDYFFEQFDIEQENVALINDDIVLPRQLSDEEYIGGGDVVRAIAEINGVFPHMGKDGLLHWISLDVGNIYGTALYPKSTTFPGTKTFPDPNGYNGFYFDISKDQYVENSVVWSNYGTLVPDGVEIRNENNQIAYYANSDNSFNPYTIINNFMCFGLSFGQYQQIAERLFKKIKLISYVPFVMNKMGDPCIEVGDRVLVHSQEGVAFLSYVFTKRTVDFNCSFEQITTNGTLQLMQYDIGGGSQTAAKLKNLDNRVGNIEKSGSGPLQILSVKQLPDQPQLNILYLIQGEVVVS